MGANGLSDDQLEVTNLRFHSHKAGLRPDGLHCAHGHTPVKHSGAGDQARRVVKAHGDGPIGSKEPVPSQVKPESGGHGQGGKDAQANSGLAEATTHGHQSIQIAWAPPGWRYETVGHRDYPSSRTPAQSRAIG